MNETMSLRGKAVLSVGGGHLFANDDDLRWRLGTTRADAYALENGRHQQMIAQIEALRRQARERYDAEVRAAKTEAQRRQAFDKHAAAASALNQAQWEEQRAHVANVDAIGKHWDRIAPIPNRIDGVDNRRFVDKVPRPRLAPHPPRRLHQGRWQELRNGHWVTL